MTTKATPGNVPLSELLGNEFGWLAARIDTEMAEYWEGAYADSGCAKDQLQRFAAEVMAPLQARIRELTLYAAQVEAELTTAKAEAAENFLRAREWAERCGAAQAEAETAYDVCGPMVGKCQACGHEHELPNAGGNATAKAAIP